MKNYWFLLRKDVFLRDLFRDFFCARNTFEKIHTKYNEYSFVPFQMMEAWVGVETKKGPLWSLKDQSHQLFRNNMDKSSLYEHLFDWTLGSIFHEAIKLKEDSYQIESYKPLLDLEIVNLKQDKELSKIIEEYFSIIEKANKNLKDDILSIDELFLKAIFHLREIFISYKDNMLLLCYWLNNKNIIEKNFGKNSFCNTLNQMFSGGIHEAYILASDHCSKGGWFQDAERYLRKAVKLDPKNAKVNKSLKELKKKRV